MKKLTVLHNTEAQHRLHEDGGPLLTCARSLGIYDSPAGCSFGAQSRYFASRYPRKGLLLSLSDQAAKFPKRQGLEFGGNPLIVSKRSLLLSSIHGRLIPASTGTCLINIQSIGKDDIDHFPGTCAVCHSCASTYQSHPHLPAGGRCHSFNSSALDGVRETLDLLPQRYL